MEDAKINYAHVLRDLRRRRRELGSAIAAIERIVGQNPGGSGEAERPRLATAHGGQICSDAFFGLSVPDAIQKYLEVMKRPCTVSEIAKGIEAGGLTHQAKNFYANVSTALRRLKDRGVVAKLPGNKWGLAAWYPGMPKPGAGKKKKADPVDGEPDAEASDVHNAPETENPPEGIE